MSVGEITARSTFQSKPEGEKGELLAFYFRKWKDDVVPHLLRPPDEFGFIVSSSDFTDASLREISGFDRLKELYLFGTSISDEGTRELTKAKSLRTLHITARSITVNGLESISSAALIMVLLIPV